MNITKALKEIYPLAETSIDYVVIDDGDGNSHIETWSYSEPQPLDEELLIAFNAANKKQVILDLKIKTKFLIESGFMSSALGSPHKYDSSLPQDQINLIGAVLKNVDIMFTCTDSNGVKIQRLHTPAQIRKVMSDGGDWISTNQANFYAQLATL